MHTAVRPSGRTSIVAAVALTTVCSGAVAFAQAPNTTPGALRTYATIQSIGIEWDVAGDDDHDARVEVWYRALADSTPRSALPLVRVDAGGLDMLAGSILYLQPGTTYEVTVRLTDPDGGAEERILGVTTRPMPALPTTGRVRHVVAGTGGGTGAPDNPFGGVAAAQASAQPGDIFLLHAGSYGGRIRFDRAGAAGAPVVWLAAGDGEVRMSGLDIAASHVWLEGLTVRDQSYATFSIGAPENVVIRRCSFLGNHYSVYLQQGGRYWYIADNTIVGDTPAASESFDGEGIELNTTEGHTVVHNRITSVADGVSYPLRNVDITGNDIFDVSDDGIEGDYGYANVRIWRNRIHNAVHNGISFQPQYAGPWYILRNQIVGNKEAAFKFRTTDRFVLLHNTIVNYGSAWPGTSLMCCNEDHLLRAFARNNLWVSVLGGQIWGFDGAVADWRTDLDFDGFDWGTATNPFSYGGNDFDSVLGFSNASGQERSGIRIARAGCFEQFDVPGPPPTPVPAQVMALAPGCLAVDSGAVLPNDGGGYVGIAPDLGAYELGEAAPVFGPRPAPAAALSAAAGTLGAGESTLLTWTTAEATDAWILPGVGRVAPSGSLTVTPSATTAYTLLASGPGGSAAATATVAVGSPAEPPAPSSLTAAVSPTAVRLAWTDNATSETGYAVERASGGSGFAALASVGADVTAFTDKTVRQNKTYSYRVRALGAAGPSGYSNTVTVRIPRK